MRNLTGPKLVESFPCSRAKWTEKRQELIRIRLRITPDVLNALKEANRRQFANAVPTLAVQTLDRGSDRGKLLTRARTVKRQEMARKSTCMDVEQVRAVVSDRLLVSPTK